NGACNLIWKNYNFNKTVVYNIRNSI
ncbi:hypothetical protein, partial [Plasmodium yoelii yoelii]